MTRLSLTIPDDLADTMRSELPDVCISKVLQQALRSMLECRHDVMSCQRCAALIERDVLADSELSRFYRDALWELRDLVDRNGSAEGTGVILKKVAKFHGISAAETTPLPRPTRSMRPSRRLRAVDEGG